MKPVNFPEANKIFQKPKDWPEDQPFGSDLHVYEQDNTKLSCWEFTNQDLLFAIFFKRIWLQVHLNIQPPVVLFTEHPFRDVGHIETIVANMVERKIKQFLIQRLRSTDNLQEISIIEGDWMKNLLTEYTNFFFEIETAADKDPS